LRSIAARVTGGEGRAPLSFKRHRFPDVEETRARRGIDMSYKPVRRWTIKFGALALPRVTPTIRP
jgi:hypothetical protein